MIVPYKDHTITASADELLDQPPEQSWVPRVYVTSRAGTHPEITQHRFKERFATQEEAENYAIDFAQEWIDHGKPPGPFA